MPTTTIEKLAKTNGHSQGKITRKPKLKFKSLPDKEFVLTPEEVEFAKLHREAMQDLQVK